MNVVYWRDKFIRYSKYHKYQKKFGFSSWHMEPVCSKPYVNDVIEYVKNDGKQGDSIVECGCGLGDIIADSAFEGFKRKGLDCKKEVINADKEIFRKEIQDGKLSFEIGSFETIKGEKVDYYIAVNFLHNIAPEQVKSMFYDVLSSNEIGNVITDSVNSSEYPYCHDFDFLCDYGYSKKCLGEYEVKNGIRKIIVYGKCNENM